MKSKLSIAVAPLFVFVCFLISFYAAETSGFKLFTSSGLPETLVLCCGICWFIVKYHASKIVLKYKENTTESKPNLVERLFVPTAFSIILPICFSMVAAGTILLFIKQFVPEQSSSIANFVRWVDAVSEKRLTFVKYMFIVGSGVLVLTHFITYARFRTLTKLVEMILIPVNIAGTLFFFAQPDKGITGKYFEYQINLKKVKFHEDQSVTFNINKDQEEKVKKVISEYVDYVFHRLLNEATTTTEANTTHADTFGNYANFVNSYGNVLNDIEKKITEYPKLANREAPKLSSYQYSDVDFVIKKNAANYYKEPDAAVKYTFRPNSLYDDISPKKNNWETLSDILKILNDENTSFATKNEGASFNIIKEICKENLNELFGFTIKDRVSFIGFDIIKDPFFDVLQEKLSTTLSNLINLRNVNKQDLNVAFDYIKKDASLNTDDIAQNINNRIKMTFQYDKDINSVIADFYTTYANAEKNPTIENVSELIKNYGDNIDAEEKLIMNNIICLEKTVSGDIGSARSVDIFFWDKYFASHDSKDASKSFIASTGKYLYYQDKLIEVREFKKAFDKNSYANWKSLKNKYSGTVYAPAIQGRIEFYENEAEEKRNAAKLAKEEEESVETDVSIIKNSMTLSSKANESKLLSNIRRNLSSEERSELKKLIESYSNDEIFKYAVQKIAKEQLADKYIQNIRNLR